MTGFLCGMLMEISLSMSAINMYKNLYSVYWEIFAQNIFPIFFFKFSDNFFKNYNYTL